MNTVVPLVTPPPLQLATVPAEDRFAMTPPEAGNAGVNLNVPFAALHVGVAAAAPPGEVITTIDSSVATAKNTPKVLRIRSPLRLVQSFRWFTSQ